MSYQHGPDPEKEHPRIFEQRDRLLFFAAQRPIAFSLCAWAGVALICALVLAVSGLEGFNTVGKRLALTFALLGGIIPLVSWIRYRKKTLT